MADDLQLQLSARVSADLSSFTRELARGPGLARQFGAEVSRAINQNVRTPKLNVDAIAGQGTTAGRAFGNNLERELTAARPFEGITAQANRAALAIAGAFGVREAVQAADAWQNAANRLRLVSDNAEQARATQERLFAVAQETRVAYAGTVDVFSRFARATESLGVSQREVLDVTRAINQAMVISGSSGDTAQAALIQLGQGLQSGALRGEELNSVLEQAPRLAQAIADGLGVGVGQLRDMGAAGQITSEQVFKALAGQAAQISAEFAQMAPTIGQAFTQVENAVQRYIGTTSQASGTGQALAGSLTALADNFEAVAAAAALAGTAIGARLIGRGIDSAVSQVRQQAVAYKEQQAAVISATFAENAHAQAIAVTAAEDVKLTQQRITNLRRVDAEIERQIALERNRLAAAAVSIDRAQTVPLSSLAPLGGAAVEREARARAAAEEAVAVSSRKILLLDEQRAATAGRLVAAERALVVATGAEAAAARVATVADTTHTAAMGRMTIGAQAAALATRGLQATLAFFGGPIGLAITGIGVAMAIVAQHTTAAEKAAEKYADRLNEIKRRANEAGGALKDMTRDQVSSSRLGLLDDLREARESLRNIKDELRGTTGQVNPLFNGNQALDYNRAIGELRRSFLAGRLSAEQFAGGVGRVADKFPQFIAQADKLRDQILSFQAVEAAASDYEQQLRQLGTVSAKAITPKAPPVVRDNLSALEEEAARLGKLREAGIANAKEMARVAEIAREAQAELTRLGKLDLSGDAAKQAQDARAEYQKILDTLTGDTRHEREVKAKLTLQDRDADKALKAFLDKAESSAIRLDVLVDLDADSAVVAGAVDELRRQYDLVTAAVKAQGGPQQAAVDSLRTQNRLAKELADHYAKAAADAAKAARNAVPAPTVTPEQIQIDQTLGSAKSALVEVFIPAKVRLDRAALTGDADAIRAAQQELKGATTLLEGAQAALAQRLAGSALSIQQQRAVLDAWAKAMQDAGLGAEAVLAPLSKLDTAATAARGVLQIADAFDRVDESTRRALDGIIGVLDGVSQARKALSGIKDAGIGDLFGSAAGLSSVVAIVGGVASLISALNKPSPITVALDSNRQALDRLSAEVNAMRPSLANLTRVGGQAQTVALDPSLLERGFLGQIGGVVDGAALARQLASLGTSFGELQAIAEQFNITLQDSKGRALQQGFADLADVMQLLRQKALTLGDGFSDLQNQFSVRADLFNLDTPQDAWDEAVAEAAKLLPPSIAKQFAAIDIDTKAGQDAARALIQRLFTQGTNGQLLDVLKASGFESISDFFSFLQFAEDPLDQLGTAAERAAQALNDVNLPPGFRKGLAEWASTAPNLSQLVDTIQTAPVQPYTPPTSYVPPTQQRPGDTNGGRQRPADSSQPIHIERVDVYGVTDVDSLLTKLRQRVTNEVRAQGGAKSASQVGPGLAI